MAYLEEENNNSELVINPDGTISKEKDINLEEEEFLKEAAEYVVACKKDSEDFYSEKFKKFLYFDKIYLKGAARKTTPYGRSNLKLPIGFQQVEAYVDQISEATIAEEVFLQYLAEHPDYDPFAEAITQFTANQLRKSKAKTAIQKFYRKLGIYGSAFYKVIWQNKEIVYEDEYEQTSVQLNPETGEAEQVVEVVKEKKPLVTQDGPVLYNISIFDMFIPRNAVSNDIQDMDYVIHRVYRNIDQLLDNPNYDKNTDKLREYASKCKNKKYKQTSYETEQNKKEELEQNNPNGATKFSNQIEVLEFWGRYDWEKETESEDYVGTDYKESLIVVAMLDKEPLVIRIEENPLKFKFKPFGMSVDYPVDGEAYGIGELELIDSLIEESTALRNMRIDISHMSLYQMWKVDRNAGVNLRSLVSFPDNVILTDDMQGLARLEPPSVTPSSVNELSRIDYDIQNTNQIINPRQDVSNVGAAFGSTATGVNFLTASANLRLRGKIRILNESLFEPLALMLLWYNKEFITQEKTIRYFDGEQNPFVTITPEILALDYEIKSVSNPEKLTVGERRENMSYLLQVIAQVEKVAPGTNDLYEILKEVYKISGFPHPEKYVKPQQTTVLQLPDGNLADVKGQPIQVVPVDEQGQPLETPSQGVENENQQ